MKAFLFDYDGVITAGVGDKIPATRLARNIGISLETASELIVSIWDELSTGKISEEAAWQKMEAQHGSPIAAEHRDIWYTWEELTPLPQMLSLVRMLREKGYPVGVASNVLPPTARLIKDRGGYDDFDFLILSYEVGARKPKPAVYAAAMAQLPGVLPGEVVFLDDREPCVAGAEAFGLRAIHVTDHQQAIEAIQQILT